MWKTIWHSGPLHDNEFRFGYRYYFYATFSTLTFNLSACTCDDGT